MDVLLDLFKELPDLGKVIVFLIMFALVLLSTLGGIIGWWNRGKLVAEIGDLKKGRDAALREKEELESRFKALDKVDDHVWKRDVKITPPPFVSRSKRKTRFIAVCNLKGGVGKSTLVGNLGLGLALQERSVLMIDLDFQGTLSSYVCDPEALAVARTREHVSRHLLDSNAEVKLVHQYATAFPSIPLAQIIPADEGLELTEYAQQARFFVNPYHEVRFLLRRLLHDEAVTDKYDYVLFDCPPRMTTACINALTCSDAVLLPTSLDKVDTDSVYRTLTWFRELKDLLDLEFLGIVLSKCQLRNQKLTKADASALNDFRDGLKRHWLGRIEVLETVIPDSPYIGRSGSQRRPSVLDEKTRHWFLDLAEEVERRIRHEVG